MARPFQLILLLTVVLGLKASAQKSTEAHFKNGEISFYKDFNVKYNEVYATSKLDACVISVTFAKFNIDKTGNVINLTFYEKENNAPIFRELLDYAITASNGKWVPATSNGIKVVSKPFVVPLLYRMEAGCKGPAPVMDANIAISNFWSGMLKAKGPADCILLSSLEIFSSK